jgi:hypothetical protein
VLGDESSLKTRQASSQREFFRLLGKASQSSSVVSLPGSVQATAAPIRPWYSIFNCVVLRDVEVLLEQLDDLASTVTRAPRHGQSGFLLGKNWTRS